MSDRIKGFIVVLDKDYRDDDASEIRIALQNIRGVCKVTPSVMHAEDVMNQSRIKSELIKKIYEVLS
jgi:hypothetical protein